jgi:hypothetical protein
MGKTRAAWIESLQSTVSDIVSELLSLLSSGEASTLDQLACMRSMCVHGTFDIVRANIV